MRSILATFLLFTVFSSFVAVSYHNEVSSCEVSTSCETVDLHDSSDSGDDHKNHCHVHCHLRFTSSLINYPFNNEIHLSFQELDTVFPEFQISKLTNYYLDIIRPPIS